MFSIGVVHRSFAQAVPRKACVKLCGQPCGKPCGINEISAHPLKTPQRPYTPLLFWEGCDTLPRRIKTYRKAPAVRRGFGGHLQGLVSNQLIHCSACKIRLTFLLVILECRFRIWKFGVVLFGIDPLGIVDLCAPLLLFFTNLIYLFRYCLTIPDRIYIINIP